MQPHVNTWRTNEAHKTYASTTRLAIGNWQGTMIVRGRCLLFALAVIVLSTTQRLFRLVVVASPSEPRHKLTEMDAEHENETLTEPFSCEEVGSVEIARELGRGANKAAFEVILPNGKHVVAKRCWRQGTCERVNQKKELYYLTEFQRQFPRRSLKVHGFCMFEGSSSNDVQNFAVGTTLFVEMTENEVQTFYGKVHVSAPQMRQYKNEHVWSEEPWFAMLEQYSAFEAGPLLVNDVRVSQYGFNARGQVFSVDLDSFRISPLNGTFDRKRALLDNCLALGKKGLVWPKTCKRRYEDTQLLAWTQEERRKRGNATKTTTKTKKRKNEKSEKRKKEKK